MLKRPAFQTKTYSAKGVQISKPLEAWLQRAAEAAPRQDHNQFHAYEAAIIDHVTNLYYTQGIAVNWDAEPLLVLQQQQPPPTAAIQQNQAPQQIRLPPHEIQAREGIRQKLALTVPQESWFAVETYFANYLDPQCANGQLSFTQLIADQLAEQIAKYEEQLRQQQYQQYYQQQQQQQQQATASYDPYAIYQQQQQQQQLQQQHQQQHYQQQNVAASAVGNVNTAAVRRERSPPKQQQQHQQVFVANAQKVVVTTKVVGTSRHLERAFTRNEPTAQELRPLSVLRQALSFLFNKYKENTTAGTDSSGWLALQFKGMRQDLKIQKIENDFAVRVYEFHARHALALGDLSEYIQCQSALRGFYNDLQVCDTSAAVEEFTIYRLLFLTLQNEHELLSSEIHHLSILNEKCQSLASLISKLQRDRHPEVMKLLGLPGSSAAAAASSDNSPSQKTNRNNNNFNTDTNDNTNDNFLSLEEVVLSASYSKRIVDTVSNSNELMRSLNRLDCSAVDLMDPKKVQKVLLSASSYAIQVANKNNMKQQQQQQHININTNDDNSSTPSSFAATSCLIRQPAVVMMLQGISFFQAGKWAKFLKVMLKLSKRTISSSTDDNNNNKSISISSNKKNKNKNKNITNDVSSFHYQNQNSEIPSNLLLPSLLPLLRTRLQRHRLTWLQTFCRALKQGTTTIPIVTIVEVLGFCGTVVGIDYAINKSLGANLTRCPNNHHPAQWNWRKLFEEIKMKEDSYPKSILQFLPKNEVDEFYIDCDLNQPILARPTNVAMDDDDDEVENTNNNSSDKKKTTIDAAAETTTTPSQKKKKKVNQQQQQQQQQEKEKVPEKNNNNQEEVIDIPLLYQHITNYFNYLSVGTSSNDVRGAGTQQSGNEP